MKEMNYKNSPCTRNSIIITRRKSLLLMYVIRLLWAVTRKAPNWPSV